MSEQATEFETEIATGRSIKIVPTWQAAVRIFCAVLQNPDAPHHVHAEAEKELLRLAKVVDDMNAEAESE